MKQALEGDDTIRAIRFKDRKTGDVTKLHQVY